MKITKIIAVLMIVLMTLVVAGCDKDNNPQTNKNTNTVVENKTEKTADEKIKVKVYFPNNDATRLVAVEKTVKTSGTNKYKAVMEALMEGTNDSKLSVVMPKQAKLLGVSVSGDTAKVDFDKALVKNFNGGSTGEEFLVGSIVNTLTEFPEIKKVQITIEGRNVESIKGHMDTSKPLPRMDELLK
ncbi:spore germination-like protein [Anaerovibrio sp. JC8]|uniref:GerMN domain-containing protein n=1 Tax=Anaerovibrio sp. JC8 TaxID=1240085 RepID=UPI000A0E2E8A|nr:GerMN domain-containing protein [Anaerovibrio sp. JC8]ORU01310.1 spore germination-like protein [Anaerovibrio sp. JC8]